jgi:hypothetical protein
MIEQQESTETGEKPVEEKHRLPLTPQIRFLSRLIEADPDAPVNYLLRGEEWLMCGEPGQARADFEAARDRSEHLLDQSAWGYIYQAYIDRAERGLRQCRAGAAYKLGEEY